MSTLKIQESVSDYGITIMDVNRKLAYYYVEHKEWPVEVKLSLKDYILFPFLFTPFLEGSLEEGFNYYGVKVLPYES